MSRKSLYFLTRKAQNSAFFIKNFSQAQRQSLATHGSVCHYCGDRRFQAFDHIVPSSKGGGNNAENLVPACQSCNSAKGAKSYDDFKFIMAAEKIAFEMYLECGGEDAQL